MQLIRHQARKLFNKRLNKSINKHLTQGLAGTCLLILAGCGEETNTAVATPVSPSISASTATAAVTAPVEVKMVVVTMFEIGEDSGDAAGEFQLWKERAGLTQQFAFPQSHHDLYLNPETGVLGMVTGMGTAKSASAVMALGLDPRFDLTHAYWLVVGIAGVDPEDASVGSAAWARYLVDGDLAHEIDPREMPADWTTGYFPLFAKAPFPEKRPESQGEVFTLNTALAEWAFHLTETVELPDDDAISALRAHYTATPNGQKPPFVLMGDNLAAMTFWHGDKMNAWANQWVKYWTDGKGEFVTSAMEDTGTMQSLTYLDRAGKADAERLMVLRTASNYSVPPPGVSAAANLAAENEGYAGLQVALESAWRVGSKVVNEITGNWDTYKLATPVNHE